MNPLSQLLRQPVRFLTAIIILALASASVSLGWGAVRSALTTAKSIENKFLTIAEVKDVKTVNDLSTPSDITVNKKNEYLDFETGMEIRNYLKSSPYLRKEVYNRYFSAISDSLRPPLSFNHSKQYDDESPYDQTVLTVKITEKPDFSAEDAEYNPNLIYVYGEITGYLALCPGYPEREKIEILLSSSSSPGKAQSVVESLEIGKEYIIYSNSYMDAELSKLTDLSNAMDMTGVLSDYNYEDYLQPVPDNLVYACDDGTYVDIPKDAVNVFVSPSGRVWPVYEHDIKLINAGLVSIDVSLYEFAKSAEERGATYDEALKRYMGYDGSPFIQEIGDSLEEFLSSPENNIWVERIENCNQQYKSAPVLGVERLESIYDFHENIISVTAGRSFSEDDYKKGNRVCIISEQTALETGLNIGDSLSMSFYEGEMGLALDEINAFNYYDSIELSESSEFEIIGLYRNAAAYNSDTITYFGADTVFVPSKVLDPYDTGKQFMTSFTMGYIMENGSAERINEDIIANGWEGFLVVYDSGFPEIASTLDGLKQSSFEVFAAASAVFVTVITAYIALFVMKQRHNAGLMLSLGAGRKNTVRFVTAISMIPAVIASIIGGTVGTILLNKTVTAIFSGVNAMQNMSLNADSMAEYADETAIEITVTPLASVAASALVVLVYLAVIWLVARHISTKKPLDLIKSR